MNLDTIWFTQLRPDTNPLYSAKDNRPPPPVYTKKSKLKMKEVNCKKCGKLFLQKSIRQEFCGEECRRIYTGGSLFCKNCGNKFIGTNPTQHYCSKYCRDIHFKMPPRIKTPKESE
jgi:endogenous inhibitor of DNA gyrase (YacG/DUF329 family)